VIWQTILSCSITTTVGLQRFFGSNQRRLTGNQSSPAAAQRRSLQYKFQEGIEGKTKKFDWQPILSFSTTTTIVGGR
jgi:hypothetical protein